ncbi:MAG TPA: Gfo/Idh/MocA family oxidoreductase [Candidatus Limnocylindria bacterium]|nr:Gfo/Idh/MocA family oxidoreductase [Candidatus Limnocylindria bacterium]
MVRIERHLPLAEGQSGLAHFLRFAHGEAENACTAADALEALRIAEAASRSHRERRTVKLSEVD